MTPIFLCYDEPIWLARLEQIISDYSAKNADEFHVVFSDNSPTALLQYLAEHPSSGGVYFLDAAYKAQASGITLGCNIRSLDASATLIYIASHEEMMRETFRFKLQVLDYILKDDEDVTKRIYQCLNHLEQSRPALSGAPSRIMISAGRSRQFLEKDEIYYIHTEKGSHQIQIHTKSNVVTAYTTLQVLKQQLGDAFLPCSRSMLVNLRHIKSADHRTKTLTLDNGETCSCSTRMWHMILNHLDH